MKYIELMQRINVLFPDVSEGMITSLFNQKSRIFQYETSYGINRTHVIAKVDGVVPEIIKLDSVKMGTDPFMLAYLDSPEVLGKKVLYANTYYYSIFGGVIYYYQSGNDGDLESYVPANDITLTGKFINQTNIISASTLLTTEFNDELALSCLFGLFGDLYRMNGETIKLAEYYDNKFRENIRLYRKYGLSAKRDAVINDHGGISSAY